jgi:hypothetical protein
MGDESAADSDPPADTADDADADGADDAAGGGEAVRDGARSSYTVRSGDTLSNLSESFLGDPGAWPKLWALNPEIPNPHWISPGMIVRLSKGGEDAKSGASAGAAGAAISLGQGPPPLATASRGPSRVSRAAPGPVRQLGFVDEGALVAAGTINGSVEEKIMLATGDQAYVEFPSGHPPKIAARFSVYHVDGDHPVRSPGSDVALGYLVSVCGEVVIDTVGGGNIATGHLVGLSGPVERGYRVGPLIPQLRAVAPRPNGVNVTGRVVASVDPGSLLATQTFVVLDRGRRHGVEAGNRFLILRQGDGLKRLLESAYSSDPRFPPNVVAEIVAVDVRNETTVGWISRGSRELRVGDVADLHRGY